MALYGCGLDTRCTPLSNPAGGDLSIQDPADSRWGSMHSRKAAQPSSLPPTRLTRLRALGLQTLPATHHVRLRVPAHMQPSPSQPGTSPTLPHSYSITWPAFRRLGRWSIHPHQEALHRIACTLARRLTSSPAARAAAAAPRGGGEPACRCMHSRGSTGGWARARGRQGQQREAV